MLEVIYILACLIGICSFIQRITYLTVPQTIFFTVPLIGLINYSAILFAKINTVEQILIYFGYSWLLIEIFWRSIKKQKINDFSIALIYICIAILISIIVNHAYFHAWDEFSFWGKLSKLIYLSNSLPTEHTPIAFKDYPPGAALFHYFIYKISGKFSEQLAYLAQDILLITPLFMMISNQWRKQILILIALIFIISTYDYSLFNTLYVDLLISSYFAAIIFTISDVKNDYQKYLTILPAILFLVLIKQVGYFFAFMCLTFVIANILLTIKENKAYKYLGILSFYILGCTLLIFMTHHTWVMHYEHLQIQKTFATSNMQALTLFNTLVGSADTTITLIRSNFLKAIIFSGKEVSRLHLSTLMQLLIFIALGSFLLKREKNNWEKKQIIVINSLLMIGFLFYSIGLLSFYLRSFSVPEAMHLASFGRYMHIYLVAYALVLIGLLMRKLKLSNQQTPLVICLALVFLCFTVLSKPKGIKEERLEVMRIANMITKQIQTQEIKLYVIYQNDHKDNGAFGNMLSYELFPVKMDSCFSLGKPYRSDDVWTCDMKAAELANKLRHFDYVLVQHTDDQFWRQYGRLFDNHQSPQFFKNRQAHT